MQLARCSPPSVHTSIDSRTKPEVSADVVRARTRTQSKAAAAAPADNAAVISAVGTALSSVNNAVYEGANESINIVSRSSLDGTSSVSRTQPHKTGSAAPLYGSTSTAALISMRSEIGTNSGGMTKRSASARATMSVGISGAKTGMSRSALTPNVALASTLVPDSDDAVALAIVRVEPFLTTSASTTIGQTSGRTKRAVRPTNARSAGTNARIWRTSI